MPIDFAAFSQGQLEALRRAGDAANQRAALLTDTGRMLAQTSQAYADRNNQTMRDLWRMQSEMQRARMDADVTMRGQDFTLAANNAAIQADIYNTAAKNAVTVATSNQADKTSRSATDINAATERSRIAENRRQFEIERAYTAGTTGNMGTYLAINKDGSVNTKLPNAIASLNMSEGTKGAKDALFRGSGTLDSHTAWIKGTAAGVARAAGVDRDTAELALRSAGKIMDFGQMMDTALLNSNEYLKKIDGMKNPRARMTAMYGKEASTQEVHKDMADIESYTRIHPRHSPPPAGITLEQHKKAHELQDMNNVLFWQTQSMRGGEDVESVFKNGSPLERGRS